MRLKRNPSSNKTNRTFLGKFASELIKSAKIWGQKLFVTGILVAPTTCSFIGCQDTTQQTNAQKIDGQVEIQDGGIQKEDATEAEIKIECQRLDIPTGSYVKDGKVWICNF